MSCRNIFILFYLTQAACSPGNLSFETTSEGISISENGKKVLFYQSQTKSKAGKYPRSNYIHPLYGIDGAVITEDFPDDHPHHRGVFWAWHQVIIGNTPIGDSWECMDFIWDVVKAEPVLDNGNMLLTTETLWKSPLWTNKNDVPEAFLKENTTITVHPAKNNYRILDFEIALLALVPDLRIGGSDDKKGYGGFSVRMKIPEDIKFFTSQGEVIPKTEAVEAGPWMDISGSLAADGGKAGIIMMNQDKHMTHHWILRDKESMQNIVYPGREPIAVSEKRPTVLKYRLFIYVGKMPHDISELNR